MGSAAPAIRASIGVDPESMRKTLSLFSLRLVLLVLLLLLLTPHSSESAPPSDDDDGLYDLNPVLAAAITSASDCRLLASTERRFKRNRTEEVVNRWGSCADEEKVGGFPGLDSESAVLRCAALLRIAANDHVGAATDLLAARAASTILMPNGSTSSNATGEEVGGSIARAGSGARGGCPPLHGSLFSTAVTLMHVRDFQDTQLIAEFQIKSGAVGNIDAIDQRTAVVNCDDHISIASELEELGLHQLALRHMDAAAIAAATFPETAIIGSGNRGVGGGLRTASGSSDIDIKALRDSAADASIAEKEKVKWTDIFAARET